MTPDVWNGWFVGAGAAQSAQAILAYEFYKNVVGGVNNVLSANATFTGHSLGGGLAGLVAGIYKEKAVLFDNMPFESAVSNAYTYATRTNAQIAQIYNVNTQAYADAIASMIG